MPSLQLLNMFGRQLTKMSIVTSVPISFSLVGLQAIMDVKLSCPCKAGWNRNISAFVFCIPTLFAFVIMFALLRPFQYKHSCCQKQNNSGAPQRKDNKKTSQGEDNKETSQGQDKSEISQEIAYLVCCIPSLVWICLCLIDGDYIACGLTNWNGRYACDKELHPNCFNWCKPTELSPEINETECYEKTRKWIYESKIAGYSLAIIFCIITIILVSVNTSAETKTEGVASEIFETDELIKDKDSQQGKLQMTSIKCVTGEASQGHRMQNRSDVSDQCLDVSF